LADMTPEQLEAIEGIGPKTVEKISLAVNNYFASLEQGEAVEGEVSAEGATVDGEAAAEEAAPEAAEVVEGEVAVEGEPVAAAEAAAEAESAAPENEEHEPKDGSAPETTE